MSAFTRIGLLSFGGPAAQIALMHKVLVDEKAWLKEQQFLGALSFCMLLPGPEAMQLATYTGWKLRGTLGGLIAGLLFIIPGAIVIFALALLYITYGAQPWAQAAFLGIKAAVITIVALALRKFASKALTSPLGIAVALAAFAGFTAVGAPYPLIIVAAALTGALFMRSNAPPDTTPASPQALTKTLRTLLIGVLLWLTPLALLWALQATFLTELASYFTRLALLSFGGAYALLGWMTQTVVQDYGWITTPQMIDALGMAETTPGPLILVTQFVGHLAGYGQGGFALMVLAGLLTLWMTFTPCFLWIFAGAPYLEQLLAMPRLKGALAAITAAVTGVIASLSLWFALSVLLPDHTLSSFNWQAALLIGTGVLIAWRSKASLGLLIGGNALIGLALAAISGAI
nr:chromate efflux transporter [Lentibacter algarum]